MTVLRSAFRPKRLSLCAAPRPLALCKGDKSLHTGLLFHPPRAWPRTRGWGCRLLECLGLLFACLKPINLYWPCRRIGQTGASSKNPDPSAGQPGRPDPLLHKPWQPKYMWYNIALKARQSFLKMTPWWERDSPRLSPQHVVLNYTRAYSTPLKPLFPEPYGSLHYHAKPPTANILIGFEFRDTYREPWNSPRTIFACVPWWSSGTWGAWRPRRSWGPCLTLVTLCK